VHRSCLNDWRAYSTNPTSFSNCDVCGFKYELRERPDLKASRIRTFALRVTRDILGSMLVIQAIVVILSIAVYFIDQNHALLTFFPSSWNKYGVYYIWGLFVFSMIVACYGASYCLYMCGFRSSSQDSVVSHNTYPYYWGPYFYWFYYPSGYSCCPMCYCGDCGNVHHGCAGCMHVCASTAGHCGGNNNNNAIAICGIIVMAIAITVGFIVMVVVATIILRRHAAILQKQQDAREMEVVNLEEQNLDLESI